MTRIYTRTGDKGQTGLFDGSRVAKDDLRVEAYGTVDELCSVLSLARLSVDDEDLRGEVRDVQRFLFVVGADLATPAGAIGEGGKGGSADKQVRRVTQKDVEGLEGLIDKYWARLNELGAFVVPGETVAAAHLHVARTVCRRAERLVVRLAREDGSTEVVLRYLNRLSDLLFAWGRWADEGKAEADPVGGLRGE